MYAYAHFLIHFDIFIHNRNKLYESKNTYVHIIVMYVHMSNMIYNIQTMNTYINQFLISNIIHINYTCDLHDKLFHAVYMYNTYKEKPKNTILQ